jgi:hypothetical protein
MRSKRTTEGWPAAARPPRRIGRRHRVAGVAGLLLAIGGGSTVVVAAHAQQHAPQPSPSAAGVIAPRSTAPASGAPAPGSAAGSASARAQGPSLARSVPVSISIPAIGVHSSLLQVGLNPDGTLQVPPLYGTPGKAAWYKYSRTPGQIGASIIEGHIDSYRGPSVFFRLGALRPGNTIDVTLASGTVAVFDVTGVRSYPKTSWPWRTIFGNADYAALRLITCGGTFDYATRHYLSNTVVFASLARVQPPPRHRATAPAS